MRIRHHRRLLLTLLVVTVFVVVGLVIAQDQETLKVRTDVAATEPRFPAYLARLLGHGLTDGNSVVVHTNGDAAFPAMLAAIAAARHRISFETYIFDQGMIAERFTEAFEAGIQNADAAALATAGSDCRPSVRFVLCKGADERGFVLYTNIESRKAQELVRRMPRW